MNGIEPEEVLGFWLGTKLVADAIPDVAPRWFARDDDFDREIALRFDVTLGLALRGDLESWAATPRGRLALVLVLDQFTRNTARGAPAAFSGDARAILHASEAVRSREDATLLPVERMFLYLPFEHSEDRLMQDVSVTRFQELRDHAPLAVRSYFDETLVYARRHREIIERFGRFPHRNATLGRASTPEELTFLREPLSSF